MDSARTGRMIEEGACTVGIELGSTRIKAVMIDDGMNIIAKGIYDWENRNEDGVWTYALSDIEAGLKGCYADLKKDVREKYNVILRKVKAFGISAMMHGYMAFDNEDVLLTPFRTWRNTMTGCESHTLSELFNYPIPLRWTISHLLYDINREKDYLRHLARVSTLSSYVHYRLTGRNVVGIGDASGMFPIDFENKDYDRRCIGLFSERYGYDVSSLFPKVLVAGEVAGMLTREGALLLDSEGDLEPGSPFCAPEGDAETGMVATNSIAPLTGNVSAGTSAFAMVVLDKPLSRAYPELDIVTTPDGQPVAMAHTNNCTGGYDSWLRIFDEVLKSFGCQVDKPRLYDTILEKALAAAADCGGLVSYNYISGEPIVGCEKGVPLFVRQATGDFNLSNFIRSELYASVAAMRIGMDILYKNEGIRIGMLTGHGGFFKTEKVGLQIMAAALQTPVRVLSTAGEGGAWGIAILAEYLFNTDHKLSAFLEDKVFTNSESRMVVPGKEEKDGFDRYFTLYKKGLSGELDLARSLEE